MNAELNTILSRVTAQRRLRVWSVILTFFGDAVLSRGGKVSAQTVSQLMQALGIEDGAVRTAFSRLTKDGWVIRSKLGRSSYYTLAEKGLEPFAEASTRIYSVPNHSVIHEKWVLATCNSENKEQLKLIANSKQAWMIEANFAIFTNLNKEFLQELKQAQCLITLGTEHSVPDWIKNHNRLKLLQSEIEIFIENFKYLPTDLPPLEAMAARCLLIHEWRRLILKIPNIPKVFLNDDWNAQACGELVANQYNALKKASESWLDEKSEMPENRNSPNQIIMQRFNMLQK